VKLRDGIMRIEESLKNIQNKDRQLKLAGELAELHQKISYLDSQYPSHEAVQVPSLAKDGK